MGITISLSVPSLTSRIEAFFLKFHWSITKNCTLSRLITALPKSRETISFQRRKPEGDLSDRLPEGSLLEHVLLGRVDGPVVTLARPAQRLGQLDEALVQRQVVAHRVFPALVGAPEERELGLIKKMGLLYVLAYIVPGHRHVTPRALVFYGTVSRDFLLLIYFH